MHDYKYVASFSLLHSTMKEIILFETGGCKWQDIALLNNCCWHARWNLTADARWKRTAGALVFSRWGWRRGLFFTSQERVSTTRRGWQRVGRVEDTQTRKGSWNHCMHWNPSTPKHWSSTSNSHPVVQHWEHGPKIQKRSIFFSHQISLARLWIIELLLMNSTCVATRNWLSQSAF